MFPSEEVMKSESSKVRLKTKLERLSKFIERNGASMSTRLIEINKMVNLYLSPSSLHIVSLRNYK
jgi:hypothetical protein